MHRLNTDLLPLRARQVRAPDIEGRGSRRWRVLKQWLAYAALMGGLFVCASHALAQTYTNADAISREVSLFNFGQSSANVEAFSREVSLFNLGQSSAGYEAFSREVSLFNLGQSSAGYEAFSREVSLFNLGQSSAGYEAFSREVSLFNLGQSSATNEAISREVSVANIGFTSIEAISREVSVLVSTNPVRVTLPGLLQTTGSSGMVPIYVASEVALTNLAVTWVTPPGRVINVSITPIVPQICASTVTVPTNGQAQIHIATCPNQWLVGTQQIAWLNFTLAAGQSSAFVYPVFTGLQASELNGYAAASFAWRSGRLVVVDVEPLLECVRDTSGQPLLWLYGQLGFGYSIEWRTNATAGAWQQILTNITLTNLSLAIPPPASASRQNFYRAVRRVAVGVVPLLECVQGTNGQPLLLLYGQPGSGYSIEWRTNLAAGTWLPVATNITLTNLSLAIPPPASASRQNFYRALRLIE